MTTEQIRTEWIFAIPNSPSDDRVVVVDFLVSNGTQITQNTSVIEVEGAKSIYEIESPVQGFVYFFVAKGAFVEVGSPLALISNIQLADPFESFKPPLKTNGLSVTAEDSVPSHLVFTKKAREFQNRVKFKEEVLAIEYKNGVIQDSSLKRFFTSNLSGTRTKTRSATRILMLGGGTGADIAFDLLGQDEREKIVGVADPFFNVLEPKGVPLVSTFEENELLAVVEDLRVDAFLVSHNNLIKRAEFLSVARKSDIPLYNAKSQQSYISDSAECGEGIFTCDFARVGAEAYLGDNIFMSAFVNIDHHCVVGDNSTFGPGVFLSGRVIVGRNCVFGSSVSVEPQIFIGEGCTIASGVVITQDVPPNTIVKNSSKLSLRSKGT